MAIPLGQTDLQQPKPAREVGYYGGVRQSWEQARAGLEAVVQHLTQLLQQAPDNVSLERYITQVNKLLAKVHKLQMRQSRVRDQRGPQPRPKMGPGPWGEIQVPDWQAQTDSLKGKPTDPNMPPKGSGSPFNPGGPASDDPEETFDQYEDRTRRKHDRKMSSY